ncbi:NAD-dependent epimerase/dehydratase family protein [Propioniciclava soli]|uniref:UDP-glucose 4-epimerase n=1 Tax=Propioniciclava soli TaxID=2775081 RepID=A0ABZ3C7H9_9ACTN
MTSWLVTGGAGYIGSHVARVFAERGIGVVVVDDLSSGHREFVDPGVPFVEGSILDGDLLGRTFAAHDVEGVIHIAGFKYAGESVKRPLHTLRQNVVGTMVLLEEMQRAGVGKVVFSSSAGTRAGCSGATLRGRWSRGRRWRGGVGRPSRRLPGRCEGAGASRAGWCPRGPTRTRGSPR